MYKYFIVAQQPPLDQGLFIIEASWSHSDAPHSVVLLWMGDEPDAENSTWQHATPTTDRHPCYRWDSNPQFQQATETGFMYIICIYHLLTSNWSLTWSFRLSHRLSMASCADWPDCRIRKLLEWSNDCWIDCLRTVSDVVTGVEFRHTDFNSRRPVET